MKPIYKTFPGWNQPTKNLTQYNELPAEAQSYLEFIEDFIGVRIEHIGVGPDREHMLNRHVHV